jgi:hypothetical protein
VDLDGRTMQAFSKIVVRCQWCQETFYIPCTQAQKSLWRQPDRPNIQYIFPELSLSQRELLISATCGDCFDGITLEEDEEEEEYDETNYW